MFFGLKRWRKIKTGGYGGISMTRQSLHNFRRNKMGMLGLILIVVIVLFSIIGPFFSPWDPKKVNPAERHAPPSAEHWLGTDQLGRDTLTRIMYGGRVSIFIGIMSAVLSTLIGVILGSIAGYYGKWFDSAIIYISEIMLSFPSMIITLVVVGIFGQSIENVITIFSLTSWAQSMRMVRSRILTLREEGFVESCVANGIGGASIMFRHMLPNLLGIVIVNVTLSTGGFILAESGLSFIGYGIPTGIPTWGNMINAARSFNIMQNYITMWMAPGLTLTLFIVGLNFLGDGLVEAFDMRQV